MQEMAVYGPPVLPFCIVTRQVKTIRSLEVARPSAIEPFVTPKERGGPL